MDGVPKTTPLSSAPLSGQVIDVDTADRTATLNIGGHVVDGVTWYGLPPTAGQIVHMTDTGTRLIIVTGDQENPEPAPDIWVHRAGDQMTGKLWAPTLEVMNDETPAIVLHRPNAGRVNLHVADLYGQGGHGWAVRVAEHANETPLVDIVAANTGLGAVQGRLAYMPGPATATVWDQWHIPTEVQWVWCGSWEQWANYPAGVHGWVEVTISATIMTAGCDHQLGITSYPNEAIEQAYIQHLGFGRCQRPAYTGPAADHQHLQRTMRVGQRATAIYRFTSGDHPIVCTPMIKISNVYGGIDYGPDTKFEVTGIRMSWRFTPGLVWDEIAGLATPLPAATALDPDNIPAHGTPATPTTVTAVDDA